MSTPEPVPPTATVVICVYTEERWDDIVAAVDSVLGQDVPPAELLVVVDHDPALLERAAQGFTHPVRVLANTRGRGLSGARNTAVAAATGDVVVFLDDDATARPGWLGALLAPYADPEVLAVGGVAHPRFPADRPELLPSGGTGTDATGELDWVVGCTYTGQPTERAEVRNLMGCNMSVRRKVFSQVGGFAEDLGRIGRNPLGCEETEFCIRVRQAYRRTGGTARIVFEPAAEVDHRVGADRVSWSYLRRRSWSEGLSKAAVSRLVGPDDALSTERAYVAHVLPGAVLREWRAGRRGSAAAVLVALAATTAGYLRGRLPGATSGTRLPAAESTTPRPGDVGPAYPWNPDAPTTALPLVPARRAGGG